MQQRGHTDVENGHSKGAISIEKQEQQNESKVPEHIQKQTAVFHWQNVCYDIKIKKEERRILDHVDGWVGSSSAKLRDPTDIAAPLGPTWQAHCFDGGQWCWKDDPTRCPCDSGYDGSGHWRHARRRPSSRCELSTKGRPPCLVCSGGQCLNNLLVDRLRAARRCPSQHGNGARGPRVQCYSATTCARPSRREDSVRRRGHRASRHASLRKCSRRRAGRG